MEFEAILHRQSGDAVAANNLAVAKMYSVDLTGAVTTLEGCLQVCPRTVRSHSALACALLVL